MRPLAGSRAPTPPLALGALVAVLALALFGARTLRAARPAANDPLRQNLAAFLAQADRTERISNSSEDFSAAECYLHTLLSLAEDLRASPPNWAPHPDRALAPERLLRAHERAAHLCRTRDQRRRLSDLQNRFDDAVAYLAGA